MKFNNLVNNFAAGEWSPKMRGRSEVQQYNQACEELYNFLPQIQGGAFRRPGSIRIDLDDASAEADLQSVASNTIVKSKMIPRVLSNGSKTVLIATDSFPASTWFSINAASPSNGPTGISASGFANSPATAASIKYTQVGDYVFMVDGTGQVMPRIWSGNTLWQYNTPPPVGFYSSKTTPYLPPNANSSGGTIAVAGAGPYTLTSSGFTFEPGHEGAFFKFSTGGNTGVLVITAYTSGTSVTADYVTGSISVATYGAAAGTSWEESAWSDYRGWPKTITAFQGRIIYGGSQSYPDTLWGSRIGNVFDMMERPFEQDAYFADYPEDNSRPFTLTPNSKEASNIRALSSDKTLLIHTDRSEIVGYGTNGAMGPLDVQFDSSTSFGANAPMPVRVNNYALFVQKGGRKLRDVLFNFDQDQYKSSDLSFVADHLTLDQSAQTTDAIVEICGATNDSSYVYAKTQNGRLLSLTLDRDYAVNAWAQVQLGGSSELKSWPLVKSICAIDGDSGEGDRIFMIVQRRVNGSNKVFLEYFDQPQRFATFSTGGGSAHQYAYIDHKSSYEKNALNRIYSLDHFKGQTVAVIADGQYLGTKVVDSSGEIDIAATYTDVICGLPYTSRLKIMPIEIGSQLPGSAQGLIKRIDELVIKFYLTYGCKYGSNANDLFDIDFKDPMVTMDSHPVLFTGIKSLSFPGDYTREAQAIIETTTPWPCNVLTITAKGMTYD